MTIEKLEQYFNNNRKKFEPFINKINFISFKNFQQNAEISFDFPITVLVGKNGSNKSSALHALYGTVPNKIISDYWFTSAIDPILGKDRPRYFYSYTTDDTKEEAQVRLVWQKKSGETIDYWETARPSTADGMNTFNTLSQSYLKSDTRWNKIPKEMMYINFKAQLSAFDKIFYHAKNPSETLTTPQNYIRYHSKALQKSINNNSASQSHYGIERIISPYFELSSKQTEDVSKILGKTYTKIGYIEHSFYDVQGGTAIISTDSAQYSEAFAGSGEFAVIAMVVKLSQCAPQSLILLDEPETSLHPGAQHKLLNYLVEIALKYKHQIVISTHSREMVESLPKEAIKVFALDPKQQKINIINNVDPSVAFSELGIKTNKTIIYVEDKLVQVILDRIIRTDNNLKNKYTTHVLGSATSIIQDFTPMFALSNQNTVQILLDGDQQTQAYINNNATFKDNNTIPDSSIINELESFYGSGIKLFASGGRQGVNLTEKINNARLTYEFVTKHVKYLPSTNGETYLLEHPHVQNIISAVIPNWLAFSPKEIMKLYAMEYHDQEENQITSAEIFEAEKNLLQQLFVHDRKYFDALKQIVFN